MSYFPIYLKMDKIKVLVVGGGHIAYEKLDKIKDFTLDIKIISPRICEDTKDFIDKFDIEFEQRSYCDGDINDFDIIVVAVDDLDLQKEIFDECTRSNKLCNSVDSVDFCNFIFPAYIKKGDLIVSISTSGKSPAVAKHLKKYLQTALPEDISDFLDYMDSLRNGLPKGKERMELLSNEALKYFEKVKK
ncbi:MAG: bifunctional precorrin-2 dehydrogenase/sirohydrochlorin ferrochelatase [Arcobacteraceae bacterium]|nr:bifunctional precorrin-2 dehydrogenase/sirohydrochlorin ferrochelatase [Arcobacteraceae bacterium]